MLLLKKLLKKHKQQTLAMAFKILPHLYMQYYAHRKLVSQTTKIPVAYDRSPVTCTQGDFNSTPMIST